MPSVRLIRAAELLEREGEITGRFPRGLVSGWALEANAGWVLQAVNLEGETLPTSGHSRPHSRSATLDVMTLVQGGLSVHPVYLCQLCYVPSSSSPPLLGGGVAAVQLLPGLPGAIPLLAWVAAPEHSVLHRDHTATQELEIRIIISLIRCHATGAEEVVKPGWGLGKSPFFHSFLPMPSSNTKSRKKGGGKQKLFST